MKTRYSLLRLILFIQLFFVLINSKAQTGLNFQGVARTSNNVILASQPISLRLSILQGSVSGIAEYVETRRVTTNAQGLFTAVIGDTGTISTLGNFTTINWKNTPKFLKIEMDAAAGNNFITIGTTQFQYVAYAQFANSVDAENIAGVVPVARGGTGANSLSTFKTAMGLDKVSNTSDLTKPISNATQTALDLKLNSADTSKYTKQTYTDSVIVAKQVLIGLKLNAADTSKYTKQTYTDSSLLTKLKVSDTTNMLSSRMARDTLSISNRINLKEDQTNKSTATDLGGTSPSDILYPTQKAVKAYVTANASSGGVADGGITTIKLADGAVTDAKVASGISKSKVGLSNVENISISTWSGTNSLTTVGTITSGIWSGTAISLNNGGTGATNAAAARTNLGLVIGTNVQAPLTAGTDYLTPNGTAAGLTNFPTLNQNTTGNASTATLAGNITATSNSTLTSLPNLTNVGTITSGTWSGTTIAVASGGTGTGTTTANSVFAGPYLNNGVPNFRPLFYNDIPDLSLRYIVNNSVFGGNNLGGANFNNDIIVSGQSIGIGGDPNQGHLNLLFGKQALNMLESNVANGYDQTMNTAIGPYSQVNLSGNNNTSLGTFSLSGLELGDNNTAIGAYSFTQNNVDSNLNIQMYWGNNNTSIGAFASSYAYDVNGSGWSPFNQNTVIGAYALSGLTFKQHDKVKSENNTAIGYKAGSNLLTGSNNIFIGNNVQPTSTTISDQIVIGNASNTSSYIYGALSTLGRISKFVTVTSNYTILSSDEIISANSTSPINIYLPSAVGIAGRTYTIKNINTGSVTLRPSFSQNIDGSNTYGLTNRYSFVKVVSNGSIWLVAGLDNVSYSVSGGLTLTDLISSNVKAKTFELTQPSSINSTSTTTLDLSTGNVLQVVLTGSTTLAFTNPKIGTYIIKIKQDATGNRTLNFPTIKWSDAAVPTITTTPNAVDLITIIYDGTDYYGSCLQNF